MRQSAITVLAPVPADRVAALAADLTAIGDHVTDDTVLGLAGLPRLHYASLSVIEDPDGGAHLLFEGNVDGSRDAFLADLVRARAAGVDAVFSGCDGYPAAGAAADPDAVTRWLLDRDVSPSVFFIGWPGRTVEEIRREDELRRRLQALLDEERATFGAGPAGERQVADRVRRFVAGDPELRWALRRWRAPFLVRHGERLVAAAATPLVGLAGAVLAAAVSRRRPRPVVALARLTVLGLVGLVGAVAVTLRRTERGDDRADAERDPDWSTAYARWSGGLGDLVVREDVRPQNHLASVTTVKAGPFRTRVLRLVLFVINAAAALVENKGSLGGIASIHFARWVLTPDGRQLIFLSNYDGSWESYLDEFIDRAASGLTAVWANTDNDVGFPSTRWLFASGGARHEERFKAYARRSQVRSLVWYSAYPHLSISNIANNAEIRAGLTARHDDEERTRWLQRL